MSGYGDDTIKRYIDAVNKAFRIAQNSGIVPRQIPTKAIGIDRSTGNLKYNALKKKKTGIFSWVIYVDDNIAPYVVYTNEEWVSPKWHGRQNPNQGWWQEFCNIFARELEQQLGRIE